MHTLSPVSISIYKATDVIKYMRDLQLITMTNLNTAQEKMHP